MPQRVWNGLQKKMKKGGLLQLLGDVRQCFTLNKVTTKTLKKQRTTLAAGRREDQRWQVIWVKSSEEESRHRTAAFLSFCIALLADLLNNYMWQEDQLLFITSMKTLTLTDSLWLALKHPYFKRILIYRKFAKIVQRVPVSSSPSLSTPNTPYPF